MLCARLIVIVSSGVLLLISPSSAQPGGDKPTWSWPEKAKNLKVLPADTPPAKLRSVMTGFTRALGVRCTHCHVGEEGKPLATYDFPSDANSKKDVARGMLRMLGSINDQLREIQPKKETRVNMWCHTCHRGRPQPMTLAEELESIYAKAGAESTVAHYRGLRQRFYGAGSYDFREPALNEVGYAALGKKDPQGAIAFFRLNVENFPESGNVHDSLGEAYLAAGDTVQAIASYERSLQLAPTNENAARTLERLRHKAR
jgi:hypothetical protein